VLTSPHHRQMYQVPTFAYLYYYYYYYYPINVVSFLQDLLPKLCTHLSLSPTPSNCPAHLILRDLIIPKAASVATSTNIKVLVMPFIQPQFTIRLTYFFCAWSIIFPWITDTEIPHTTKPSTCLACTRIKGSKVQAVSDKTNFLR
jgi:hypothetical protein